MRHGQTLSNIQKIYQGQGDSPLSKNGTAQAKLAAKFLKNVNLDAIYCSDLKRSEATAKIIAKYHPKTPILKLRTLRERYYGDWEGLTFEAIAEKYKKLYATWEKNPIKASIPHAEKLKDLQDRVVKTVKKLVKKHKSGTILIVGHGGVNRALLFHYLGMPLNNFWKIKQDNCCINIILTDGEKSKVTLLNSVCFLKEPNLKNGDDALS